MIGRGLQEFYYSLEGTDMEIVIAIVLIALGVMAWGLAKVADDVDDIKKELQDDEEDSEDE